MKRQSGPALFFYRYRRSSGERVSFALRGGLLIVCIDDEEVRRSRVKGEAEAWARAQAYEREDRRIAAELIEGGR